MNRKEARQKMVDLDEFLEAPLGRLSFSATETVYDLYLEARYAFEVSAIIRKVLGTKIEFIFVPDFAEWRGEDV